MEAEALSAEVGGEDQRVKDFLFECGERERTKILDRYEHAYGKKARQYAQRTLPKWESGDTRMSGLVAERLLALVPPLMPTEDRLRLSKGMWDASLGRKKRWLIIGPDVSQGEIRRFVHQEISEQSGVGLSDTLQKRFEWLADDDVRVYEKMVEYVNGERAREANTALNEQLPVFLRQIRESANITKNIEHSITAGATKLVLVFNPRVKGMRRTTVSPYYESEGAGRSVTGDKEKTSGDILTGIVVLMFASGGLAMCGGL